MKRFFMVILLLLGSLNMVTAQENNQPQVQGSWRAEYFNNLFLTPPIAVTTTYNEINFDWGTGAPVEGVNADNFSAHFFADIYFPQAGTYRFTIQGDDSYQLLIDQRNVLRTFDDQTPVGTRTVDVAITEGIHTFQLDYRELEGSAFLKFSWALATANTGGTTSAGGQTATVTAGRLNVRSEPSLSANVLTIVNAGTTYPVIARSSDNNWVQINVNGTTGWVSAAFVNLAGTPTQQGSPAPTTSSGPRVVVNLNLRTSPDLDSEVQVIIPRNSGIQVVGRSADSNWLRVTYNDVTGWVSTRFVTGVDVASLSVQQ